LVLLQAVIVAKTVGGSTDSLQKNKAQNTVLLHISIYTKLLFQEEKNILPLKRVCSNKKNSFNVIFLSTSWVSMDEFAFLKR
jgi:hypothetical protein